MSADHDRREPAVAARWVELSRALAAEEYRRVEHTLRYRLGQLLVGEGALASRCRNLLSAVVERTVLGRAPPRLEIQPPYPEADGETSAPAVERSAPRAAAATDDDTSAAAVALWEQTWRLAESPAFHAGRAVLETQRSLAGLARLPRRLRAAARPNVAPPPGARANGSAIRVVSASMRSFRVVGPKWFEEMLAQRRVASVASGARTDQPLLLALDAAEKGGLERVQAAFEANSGRHPFVLWLLDGPAEAARLPSALFQQALRIFATDDGAAQRLSAVSARDVERLPPMVEPRLHNPIGWWNGRAELGVRARHESAMPPRWQEPVRLARGQSSSISEQELTTLLGTTLKAANPSARNGDAWVRDWLRQTRMREVIRGAGAVGRLARIEAALGLAPAAERPLVSVLAPTRRPDGAEHVLDGFARQTYEPRELVLLLHNADVDRARLEQRAALLPHPVRILNVAAELRLGEVLAVGCEAGRGELFCRMDDDDWYGAHYLEDCVAAFDYSEADLLCKQSFLMDFVDRGELYLVGVGSEYRYTIGPAGGACLAFRRKVLERVGWRPLGSGEDTWFGRDAVTQGFPMLALDRFNFVCRRTDPARHSWQMTPQRLTWITSFVRMAGDRLPENRE